MLYNPKYTRRWQQCVIMDNGIKDYVIASALWISQSLDKKVVTVAQPGFWMGEGENFLSWSPLM